MDKGDIIEKFVLALLIAFLSAVSFSGCIGGPESTPEETLDDYISYYNSSEFNNIYDELLSSDVKDDYTRDEFHNLNRISEATFRINGYEITGSSDENGSVILTVDVIWNVNAFDIQRTKTHTIEFVVEDNRWKMNDILRPIEI
ncbi:hypothetical protein Metev_0544 [Methanohalobium evestigatum Z-7303]|uniref:NTF2-like N-terminal transpeptidase domain-containing protein n=1 Tax=Methanohalobium evestigatum (strain ATCC BAA-1072 / DSM 3721 / NBRC 107634 / OCM 161 / Z-7303) TaxID=644295 RepID=D7E8B3_METEZ|nr:NTF2-like N-terminal transpeptidase domain-containing protein [Methanohalobium evestigatum]ADI73455.1 hypothetical protein Metev_0544 [Methanohalobium evestigatum Z-7303]